MQKDRLQVGQLLGRLLRHFRMALYRRAQEAGYTDVREAHLQVFGNLDWTGTRLTDLAARANMTRPSMVELVDQLAKAGYLERRPDPRDGRAKLIHLTRKGRRVMAQAVRAVRDIEREYAATIGADRFEKMCRSLQTVLNWQSSESEGAAVAAPRRNMRPTERRSGRLLPVRRR